MGYLSNAAKYDCLLYCLGFFMNKNLTVYGKEIRKIRIDKALTAEQHANMLGVSKAFLSSVELGKKCMPTPLLFKTFDFFNLNKDQELSLIKSLSISNTSTVRIQVKNQDQAYLTLLLAKALANSTFDRSKLKNFLLQ